jgi:dimeric dUTPase (all-alpha-NTP-PPase superfamily)
MSLKNTITRIFQTYIGYGASITYHFAKQAKGYYEKWQIKKKKKQTKKKTCATF